MKTRATITIDPKLHARAKNLARRGKTTVSGLFESFLLSQSGKDGSLVDEMIGSATLKSSTDHDPLRARLHAKYLG